MQEDVITATRYATLVDSKNHESLAHSSPTVLSIEVAQGAATEYNKHNESKEAATPSSDGVLTKVGHHSARKAKDSRARARPVPGTKASKSASMTSV
jgi:hypothetical protein